MVDVGSAQVAVDVRGTRQPAIVFVSGVQDDRHVWDAVVRDLPATLMTITYDRPGLGDSSGLRKRDANSEGAGRSIADLRTMLDRLDIPLPFILVGHSLGALLAYVYAATHPSHCAGLILIDPSDPDLLPPLAGFDDTVSDSESGTRFSWQSIGQDVASVPVPTAPAVVIASAIGRWHRIPDPENYSPLDMPTIDERWQRWQQTVAARLSATLIIATQAGHRVHVEAPDLVAETIMLVVSAIRSSRPPEITTEDLAGIPGIIERVRS